MFLIVRKFDNVIVGCANSAVNLRELSEQSRVVYEIEDGDFTPDMIGQQITEYEIVE